MKEDNTNEMLNLARYFGTDRMLSKDDVQNILNGIFKLLSNFKKDNQELNKDTKKEVDDVLKTLKILQKELYQDIKDGKKEMEIQFKEQVDEIVYLIAEFKKIKPKDGKPGAPGKNANVEEIIARVLEMIKVENKTEIIQIAGEDIIQKINELDHSPENLIEVSRIKGWENFNKKSRNGFSPTVISNAMDLDSSERADGYAIVWDEANNRYKFAASGGGGGGSGTVNSGTQYRLAYYATTGTAVSQLSAITADRVLISNANGLPTHSSVTTTTLSYLDATSSIQTQLNTKITASSTDSLSNKTINLTSNTLTGTLAQFNTALSDADFLSQAGIETVTNKTIDAGANSISNIALSMFAANIIDVDTALSANSDSRLATQKAVKAYVDASVTGLLDLKGSTDTSTNPNYPSGLKGDAYYVTVAGKIGGASGKTVEVGDVYVALADNAGGTEASVGTSWFVLNQNLTGVALTSGTLAQFAATTSAQLAGVISDETGSGALVFATSPTLVTPVLGVATATSINKVAITAPATSATLTIANGKTLTANASITLAGTDSSILSLAGNLTTSGAFATTLTATATTTLTLPTTGTLATLAGAETLTGKKVTLGAGTATAGTAPLKFTSGVNLTTAEAGAMEYDGTWAYFTLSGTTRRTFVFADTIQTITNKRNQPRVYTATNNASLTPEIDTYDVFHLTAMSANTTINNKSTSTPADGEQMRFRFLDNGTSRTLSWGTDYVAKAGTALPTATTISKNLIVLFEWNANLSKWNCLASGLEA